MKKRIISLSLSTCLLIGGIAFAENTEKVDVKNSEAVVISEKVEMESNYTNYKGKIIEVNKGEKSTLITVESTEESSVFKTIKFNISEETVILSDKTQDFIESDKLVEGETVEVSYGKNTPMTKSLPPMTNPDVVVLREAEEANRLGVKVDTFNEELISVDNFLKLNITEETVIVDKKGNKINKEDLYNKDLVAFYGPIMTMSIPAQSGAKKVIALNEKEEEVIEVNKEIKSLDKAILNGKQINLTDKLYKSGETFMMPIREIAENLGYEVSWNNDTRQAELKKDANFLTATAEEDMYSFAKMIVKLGKASNLDNGTMYVPLDFVEEVMMLEIDITEDGIVNIK